MGRNCGEEKETVEKETETLQKLGYI